MVGGLDTLDKVERIEVDKKDKPKVKTAAINKAGVGISAIGKAGICEAAIGKAGIGETGIEIAAIVKCRSRFSCYR